MQGDYERWDRGPIYILYDRIATGPKARTELRTLSRLRCTESAKLVVELRAAFKFESLEHPQRGRTTYATLG